VGLLDSIMAQDAALAFTDPDTFGEAVLYSPKNGTPRTINAVVEREAPVDFNGEEVKRPQVRITVANHATVGILASAINFGGDTVTVAPVKGGAVVALSVHKVLGQEWMDGGCVYLDLR
jgi:hypothetical protein